MYSVARSALIAGLPGNSTAKMREVRLDVWGDVATL